MVNKMIVTVGISGSGKSTLCNQLIDEGFTRICPDDIRKELTGDISNQSQNGRVWGEAYARLHAALYRGENVVFDSIATSRKTRKQLCEIAEEYGTPCLAYVLMDSLSKERCRDRVAGDLEKGINRSNTVSEDSILDRQHAMFLDTLRSIDDEKFETVLRVG